MTLEELLARCRSFAQRADDAGMLSRAVIAMLGESLPCGWPTPIVSGSTFSDEGVVDVPDLVRLRGSPSDVRAFVAAVLRTCDDVDGGAR